MVLAWPVLSEEISQSSGVERPRIRILPDHVANQIAAGEVVERPAAVVKELLENALDARADRIEIEFTHGGKSYIRVEDNGIGMHADEALIALERHATSKIRAAEDLGKVLTMGFRGEALPSIASVSRFTLRTRAQGAEHGSEIFINGGKMVHQRECGMPTGTRIEVAHLFNSVPARRKFLKTDNTEAAHITYLVRLHAVARPDVAFTLLENGRKVFSSPKCPAMVDRVAEIWGSQMADDLIELEPQEGEGGMRLQGLIGKPGTGRSTRREMVTLVNGRPVDSRTLSYALTEGFHTFIPKGRYPLAFLFLEIDPASIDINIHPAKREIKFRNEGLVRQFVLQAVVKKLQALARHMPLPPAPFTPPPAEQKPSANPSVPEPAVRPAAPQAEKPASTASPAAPRPFRPRTHPGAISSDFIKQYLSEKSAKSPAVEKRDPEVDEETASKSSSVPVPRGPESVASEEAPAPGFRYNWRCLGLMRGGYALFETDAGLVVMERRAAHERVWFERLQDRFAEADQPSQRLLFPIMLELDPRASAALEPQLASLQAHGFGLEPFGRHAFRLESHPDWLPEAEAETFVRDLIDRLREGSLDLTRPELADESLARLAVSRAVKPRDDVGVEEMTELARALLQCRQPLNCPRGRPTYFELSNQELSRRFGR